MSWTNYAEQRPESAGEYLWRVPSVAVEGLVVVLRAKMGERSAGLGKTLSPEFDYWDGYRILVPDGLQWAPLDDEAPNLDVEGVVNAPCPYCRKTPIWRAYDRARGGTAVYPKPQRLNCWELVCCDWGGTPDFRDPRELARIRNAALSGEREGVAL